jgi:hypothetical protein
VGHRDGFHSRELSKRISGLRIMEGRFLTTRKKKGQYGKRKSWNKPCDVTWAL